MVLPKSEKTPTTRACASRLVLSHLVAEVSLEGVDRFSRDAAVEAAGLGRELAPIRQRRSTVTVLHSHRRRCPL